MKRSFKALISLIIIIGFQPSHLYAGETLSSEDKKNIINKKKEDIGEIKKQIKEKEKIIKKLKSKEVSILSVIEDINEKIYRNKKVLKDTMQKSAQIGDEIRDLKRDTNVLAIEIGKRRDEMKSQLRNSYMMGRYGFLEVLLSSQNYSEFEKNRYYLGRLVESENTELISFMEREKELSLKIDLLRSKNKSLEDLSLQVNKTLGNINNDRKEKITVLRTVKNQKELQIKRANELSRAAQDLENMIMKMKRQYGSGGVDFLASKGDLPMPAQGKIISRFGNHFDKNLGVSIQSKGISIQSEAGSKVATVYAGKVIYAGFFRGYGKMVIVDHGGNYYSLYANMVSLDTSVGEKLKQGDRIGEAGEPTGDNFGLYFEIRHNGIPINPDKWLR